MPPDRRAIRADPLQFDPSEEPLGYAFGGFELDLVGGRLSRDSDPIPLDPRPSALLAYLIRHRDRVVPRDEIVREVWQGLAVSDAAFASALRDLRRALGDSGRHQRFVRTIRGAGFRFVAEARVLRSPPAEWAIPDFEDLSPLVVLPFWSLSDDPADELFAQGISEDLSTALSGNPGLAVISHRVAASCDRDVPLERLREDLGVRYVVEGTARRAAGEVRVTAKLVDARTGHQSWATSYDCSASRVLGIQRDVAGELLVRLGMQMREVELDRVRRKASYDPAACEHFREGWRAFNDYTRQRERDARDSFREAIVGEPKLAEAHALLGGSLSKEYIFGWRDEPDLLDEALSRVERALELDPDVAEAHVVLAGIRQAQGRFEEAREAAVRALHANPNHDVAYQFLGGALRALGEIALAERATTRCAQLNPNPLSPYRMLDGVLAYLNGRHDEAVSIWERLRAANPDLIAPRLLLAIHEGLAENERRAARLVREALDVNPDLDADYAGRVLQSGDPTILSALRRAGLP